MISFFKAACLLVLIFLVPFPAYAEEVTGSATVVDAEHLRINGQVFRLAGIDVPAPDQICQNKAGKDYKCGYIASTGLMDLTAGATVRCISVENRGLHEIVARCDADGYDLSKGMIYTGWALPLASHEAEFRKVFKQAKTRKYGLWAGKFERPDQWRSREK